MNAESGLLLSRTFNIKRRDCFLLLFLANRDNRTSSGVFLLSGVA